MRIRTMMIIGRLGEAICFRFKYIGMLGLCILTNFIL